MSPGVEISLDAPKCHAPGFSPVLVKPPHAVVGKDSIKIDMEIKLPHVEVQVPSPKEEKKKKKPVPLVRTQCSDLSGMFSMPRFPEPLYFQSFDCVGVPDFFSREECQKLVAAAEQQGFSTQRRHRLVNAQWTDIVDPLFAEALWQDCGLQWLLEKVSVDGLVPCGLNDVIRIQKYGPGGTLGRHIDQNLHRADGRVSHYSLRVFLNSREEGAFEGGLSVFHVPFRAEPVLLEPETGLALLYPQGERCTTQEEREVQSGCKYVLRADILFCKPRR